MSGIKVAVVFVTLSIIEMLVSSYITAKMTVAMQQSKRKPRSRK